MDITKIKICAVFALFAVVLAVGANAAQNTQTQNNQNNDSNYVVRGEGGREGGEYRGGDYRSEQSRSMNDYHPNQNQYNRGYTQGYERSAENNFRRNDNYGGAGVDVNVGGGYNNGYNAYPYNPDAIGPVEANEYNQMYNQ